MNFNDAGFKLITDFEGCRTTSYQDDKGIWTIGYGCTHHVSPGMVISQEEAISRLKEDIENTVNTVKNLIIPHQISDNKFSSCVSLAYNIGVGNFKNSTLLNCLKMGHINDAANEFQRWNKINGSVSAGLSRRREAEKELYLSEDNV